MPIRPEMKARYPANWREIREAIRKRAGDRCEWCRVPNLIFSIRGGSGYVWAVHTRREDAEHRLHVYAIFEPVRIVRTVCTVAHVHDKRPEACDPSNLAFLCQRCHNRHDAKDRAATARATRAAKVK